MTFPDSQNVPSAAPPGKALQPKLGPALQKSKVHIVEDEPFYKLYN
jgi:hypothetical protein